RAEVERIEVEPLVFDLGTVGDLPAHTDEEVRDLVHQRIQRVARTERAAVHRNGDVHGFGLQDAGIAFFFQLRLPGLQRLLHLSAGLAHELAGGGFLVRLQTTDRTVGQRQWALVTRVGDAYGLQLLQVAGGRN